MIRILKLVLLLVVSQVAFAQAPSNYTNINGRYRWIAGMFDSTFHIPKGSTPSLRTGGSTNAGALFYKTSDSTVRYWTGSNWLTIADTGRFVPYTGAIDTLNMGQFGVKTKFIQFDTSTRAVNDRVLQWSNDNGTLSFGMTNGGTIEQEIGLQQFARVKNVQGSQINKGQVVYLYGASGDRATVKLADNRADSTSSKTLGIAIENIPINGEGFVGTFGTMSGFNTTGYTAGDVLYLDSIPGGITKTKPQAPYHLVFVGVVEKVNAGAGLIFTNVQNGYELDELHDVRITKPVRNMGLLVYDSTRSLWVDTTLNAIGGVTGSGIANYMTRWTGANSVDTSQIYQSSGLIGIGNITPLAKVDIYDSAATALKVKNRAFGNNQNALEVRTDGYRGYTAILEQRDSVATGTQYMTGFRKGMLPGTGNPAPGGGTSFFTQIGNDNDVYRTTSIFRARAIDTTGFAAGPSIKGSSLEIWTLKNNAFDTTLVLNQGNVGVGTGQNGIDSNLTVQNGAWFERGVRMSALPTGVGTKALRINASGTLSIADTLANGISGTGTTNYIPKYTSSSAIGNSLLFDNGTNVLINNSTVLDNAVRLQVTSSSSGVTSFSSLADDVIFEHNTNLGLTFATPNTAIATIAFADPESNLAGAIQYSHVDNSMAFATNSSERMRITSAGNLGLGTTTPIGNLDVASLTPSLYIRNTKDGSWTQGETVGALNFYTNDVSVIGAHIVSSITSIHDGVSTTAPAGALVFSTAIQGANVAEVMRLSSSGNLGLGTSSPNATLDVRTASNSLSFKSQSNDATAANNSGVLIYNTASATASTRITQLVLDPNGANASGTDYFIIQSAGDGKTDILNTKSDGYITFGTANTERMRITSGGNVGIGTTSPTEKLEVSGNAAVTGIGYLALQRQLIPVGQNGVGSLDFRWYSTGTTYVTGARIGATTEAAWSSTSAPARLEFFTTASGSTTPTERMRLDASGNLGVGTTSTSNGRLNIGGSGIDRAISIATTFTGATTRYGILQFNTVNSDVTSTANNNYSQFATQAASFTVTNLRHYTNADISLGAGSTVTNQIVYYAAAISGATNNYGFYGDVASGTNRWNLYMNGTANNYLAGSLGIGTTSINASAALHISSTTKGFLPPVMSGSQAEAISTPATGLMVYANNGNGTTITSTGWWGYDGATWVKLN